MGWAERILEHHGVKGQKWGVRRGDEAGGFGLSKGGQKKLPTNVTVTQKKPGTRVTTKGGKNQPASDDAKKAAAVKQQAKSSTLDSLSNHDLKIAVERMQLEANYSRLAQQTSTIKRGQQIIKNILGIGKTYNEVLQFQNSQAGQQLREKLSGNG